MISTRNTNIIKLTFTILFLLTVACVTAQQSITEIVAKTKLLQKQGNPKAALEILNAYFVKENITKIQPEVVWYAAQLAHLNYDYVAANNYYEMALKGMPNNITLIEDYGAYLLSIGKYDRAIEVLKPHQTSTLSKLYLAKTYYWKGEYDKVNTTEKTFSINELRFDFVRSFFYEFELAKALKFNINSTYQSDDQPMHSLAIGIDVSKKINNMFSPLIAASTSRFTCDSFASNAIIAKVGNNFYFTNLKSNLKLTLGSFSVYNQSQIIYQAIWQSKISKAFSVDINYSKEPYLYTIASTKNSTALTEKSLAFNIDNLKKLSGKVQFTQQSFDNNNINQLSSWFLFPVLTKKNIIAKIGYAFQYANADSSMYVSKNKTTSITKNIAGIYNPYFTPKNQMVHNALIQVALNLSNKFSFTTTASISLSATIDNPFLNTVYNSSGNIIIENGYAPTRYNPLEIKATTNYKLSNTVSISANYQYANLFFYTNNFVNLSTQILIK